MSRAYPLDWPPSWPRTPAHERRSSRYKVSADRARRDLRLELQRAGAGAVVLSSNVPVRQDGEPYGKHATPSDPGVAVYWTDPFGAPMQLACDQYLTVGDNIRAVGLAVECLRGLERTGCAEIIRRAAVGFRALPASAERHWRDVLGVQNGELGSERAIEQRYRELARARHPDKPGGSSDAMIELNRAREQALAWFEDQGHYESYGPDP